MIELGLKLHNLNTKLVKLNVDPSSQFLLINFIIIIRKKKKKHKIFQPSIFRDTILKKINFK